MIVSLIRTQISRIVGFDSSNTTVAARLLDWINNVRREIAKSREWTFLQKTYLLKLEPDYTDGTVAITQDANTITGTSTTFTASMVGRYIQFDGQSEWYRISKFTSTSEVIIDSDYIGSTLTTAVYVIRAIYSRVPGDVRRIAQVLDFERPGVIKIIGHNQLQSSYPLYSTTGTKLAVAEWGRFSREDEYTTGTVSGSKDSRTLTGDTTAWLDNVLPGDKIVISGDTNLYHVDRVDSDTQIILVQKLSAVVSSSTAYTATTNPDSLLIRFARLNSERVIVPINYYYHPFDFINANDEDAITRLYPELVIEGVIYWEKRAADDETWRDSFNKFSASLFNTAREGKRGGTWTPAITRYIADGSITGRTRFDNKII